MASKMESKMMIFWCFFEKGDFGKYALGLQWGHDFEGSGKPKCEEKSISKSLKKWLAKNIEI